MRLVGGTPLQIYNVTNLGSNKYITMKRLKADKVAECPWIVMKVEPGTDENKQIAEQFNLFIKEAPEHTPALKPINVSDISSITVSNQIWGKYFSSIVCCI